MQALNLPFSPTLFTPATYKPLSSLSPLRNLTNHPFSLRLHASTTSLHRNSVINHQPKEPKENKNEEEEIDWDIELQLQAEYLLPRGLRPELMPKHVAVISDGNRRWARQRGWPVKFGHMTLALVYKELSRLCCKCGIKVLTAYLFSTENWKRSKEEVDDLMNLFEEGIRSNLQESIRHGIRISIMGDRSKLPKSLLEVINEAEEKTKANSRFHLILAIGYGGQADILQACKGLCEKVKDGLIQQQEIDEKMFEQELGTNCTEFPFPDLLIRTAGNLRLSNLMCYQLAYSELYFTKTLIPDFGEEEFVMALKSFQDRNRRYGGGT